MQDLQARGEAIFARADRRTGGLLGLLRSTFDHFSAAQSYETAASMSYYALFSLFPLLILIIAIAAPILGQREAVQELSKALAHTFPMSQETITKIVQQVVPQQSLTFVVAIGLLWSATGVFRAVVSGIERAWLGPLYINPVRRQVLAIVIIAALLGLLLVSQLVALVGQLLAELPVISVEMRGFVQSVWHSIFTWGVPLLTDFLVFFLLFWRVPPTRVWPAAALVGAALVTAGWRILVWGFALYVNSGFANYQVISGSLGGVVAFMFWTYLSGWLLLFGAHLAAAVQRRHEGA